MKNWFLYRVYRFDKKLFILLVFFISATIFTNLLGWQIAPFFVWGMYSEKEKQINEYGILKITVNDSVLVDYYSPDLHGANSFFLGTPLQLYLDMKEKDGIDPTKLFLQEKLKNKYYLVKDVADKVLNGQTEYQSFLLWFKRYLEQTLKIKVNSFKIEMLRGNYDSTNHFHVYSNQLLEKWQQ